MSFSPAEFTAIVQEGFQKPSRYRVRFPLPAALNGLQSAGEVQDTLEYYTDSADLVDIGFTSRNVVRYGYGPSEKKPFAPAFNDVMLTFYNDSISSTLDFFQEWMQVVQRFNMSQGIVQQSTIAGANPASIQPYELFYKDDYAVDGMITLIDNNDVDVVTWRMRRMWPVHIANAKLGWAIVNDIHRITVMFNYMDWYVDPSLGGTLVDYYNGINNPGQQGAVTAANQYLTELYSGPMGNQGIPQQGPQ